MSLDKIIYFVKNNKKLVILGSLGFFLLIFVFFADLNRAKDINQGDVQRPTRQTQSVDEGTLKFVSSSPPGGVHSSQDSFELVRFRFSDSVDIESAQVLVSPPMEFSLIANEIDPTEFIFLPLSGGWEPFVSYELRVEKLKSLDGKKVLRDTVIYTYQNDREEIPVDTIPY